MHAQATTVVALASNCSCLRKHYKNLKSKSNYYQKCMSHFFALHDIANNPKQSWDPVPEFIKNNKITNGYKDFLIYTALSLQTCTIQQRRNIHTFLLTYESVFTGIRRITKYDPNYLEYYRLMIAIYGRTCPYLNADFSVDLSTSIIIDAINQLYMGCVGCTSTNPMHVLLMH